MANWMKLAANTSFQAEKARMASRTLMNEGVYAILHNLETTRYRHDLAAAAFCPSDAPAAITGFLVEEVDDGTAEPTVSTSDFVPLDELPDCIEAETDDDEPVNDAFCAVGPDIEINDEYSRMSLRHSNA